ncbi:OmpA family protein [Chitinimonas naiadis]
MKRFPFKPTLLLTAVLLAACGSMPRTTSLLDQTRTDYVMAQNNPQVATYAQLELKQAGDALAEANDAADKDRGTERIDKLAYVAKQKIAMTQEVAKRRAAEALVASAGKERDQMRLDQRTQEADQAKLSAVQSKANADQARASADQANLNAQLAMGETAEAQRKAQDAQARGVMLEMQLAELQARKTERGIVITLGDVLFGTDVASLNSDGMRTTQKLADLLQQNPQRTVLVEGYTDSTGSDAHNQELSERRAGSVRNTLQSMGIAGARITSRGYGESNPVAGNDTSASRQLNRRVEIVLSDDNGKVSQR